LLFFDYFRVSLETISALSQSLTKEEKRERSVERKAYKTRCRQTPPPGMSRCEEEKWKLERNKDCFNMRNRFMRKWHNDQDPGHMTALNNLISAIRKNIEYINNNCCDNCEN